ERRKAKGERRKAKGERRKAKGERRKAKAVGEAHPKKILLILSLLFAFVAKGESGRIALQSPRNLVGGRSAADCWQSRPGRALLLFLVP
ncbi:MAG TPA: hypothetical protein VF254_05055, partial [Gammaproteobacteria bacterium]